MATLPHPPAVATFALVAAAAVAGCRSSSSGSDHPHSSGTTMSAPAPAVPVGAAMQSATVDINSFQFMPVTIVVTKGGRVRWTNSDAAAHTATADDRSFDTQTIDVGSAHGVTFTSAGTFEYHCDFHPFMKGTVVVR